MRACSASSTRLREVDQLQPLKRDTASKLSINDGIPPERAFGVDMSQRAFAVLKRVDVLLPGRAAAFVELTYELADSMERTSEAGEWVFRQRQLGGEPGP